MESLVLSLVSTAVALAAVLALAYGVLRLMRGPWSRRAGAARGGDRDALSFVRALPVGPKERVVLIEHRGERWLLGVTGGGISVLGRWPGDGTEASATPASRSSFTPPVEPG